MLETEAEKQAFQRLIPRKGIETSWRISLKKNNFKCLAIALPFLLVSCLDVSPDARFKREVREAINDGYTDPQMNKEAQEVFRKYLGWEGAIALGKQHCQWAEEGKTDRDLARILGDKADMTVEDPDENITLLFVYFSIRSPAIRAYCPGRDI
ncbi:MAG: DUF732 domain-containing protein [Limnoraphis robusta]|uniref:Uncharacterized protein n=1 Tax=Limnoraphis robusta CS-951 TaxID=1637645 RepID=A0A0F5YH77_9CYAN|nr:DUF732 domain-containing protein [Limnoraphis robusta]KKD38022.1 hypothetical protein WN50_11090 [Limnoraphis robusta CS-951]